MNKKYFSGVCAYCNEEFQAARNDALYCSASCRQLAYLKREFHIDYNQTSGIKTDAKNIYSSKNSRDKNVSRHLSVNTVNTNSIYPSKNTCENNNIHQLSVNKVAKDLQEINEWIEKMKIENTNGKLKQWIEKIFEWETKERTYLLEIEQLVSDIDSFLKYHCDDLPKEYPHLDFISNTLKTKLENLLQAMKLEDERYFRLEIDSVFKQILLEVLGKI